MNYNLGVEQKLLRDEARNFFSKECDSTFIREMIEDQKGYSDPLWKRMAELGWIGLLIPERYGHSEMSFLEMAVLLYEMGYACVPGPFFSSAVLGVLTFLEAGSDANNEALLPQIASGERIVSLAWPEPNTTYSGQILTRADLRDGYYALSGTKRFVPYAHIADTIICAAAVGQASSENEGIGLFLVDGKSSGLDVEVLETIANDKQCQVTLDQVKVPKENCLVTPDQGVSVLDRVLQKAAVAKCAEMAGGAERALKMVVDHAKKREQFDRPIARFQAVQHHCANILTYADTSKFMAYQAAWRIAQGLSFEKEASMCKVWVSESYRKLMELAHQVMGGHGFMEETDLQLYFKQAKAGELGFGDAAFHREMIAKQMGL